MHANVALYSDIIIIIVILSLIIPPIVLIFYQLLSICLFIEEEAASCGLLNSCGFLWQSPLTSQRRTYKSPPAPSCTLTHTGVKRQVWGESLLQREAVDKRRGIKLRQDAPRCARIILVFSMETYSSPSCGVSHNSLHKHCPAPADVTQHLRFRRLAQTLSHPPTHRFSFAVALREWRLVWLFLKRTAPVSRLFIPFTQIRQQKPKQFLMCWSFSATMTIASCYFDAVFICWSVTTKTKPHWSLSKGFASKSIDLWMYFILFLFLNTLFWRVKSWCFYCDIFTCSVSTIQYNYGSLPWTIRGSKFYSNQ